MSFETLEFALDADGAVARIWLDRPATRNAFDDVVIGELTRASAEGREGVQAFLQKRKPSWLAARE